MPNRKALLFGINYNHSHPRVQLRGCINDVKNIGKLLEKDFDFNDVQIYTDETSRWEVSARNIVRAIYDTAIHSYQYEHVWIHFSGHGCNINDRDRDEYDGKDECIVPSDYKTAGVITDDTINLLLKHFAKSCKVTCIFDCCHSGTMGDLQFEYDSQGFLNRVLPSYKHVPCNVLMLSGCLDSQTSADAYNVINRKTFTGAMTSCLLLAIKEEGVNVINILKKVTFLLRQKRFSQIPKLTSSRQINKYTKLIY